MVCIRIHEVEKTPYKSCAFLSLSAAQTCAGDQNQICANVIRLHTYASKSICIEKIISPGVTFKTTHKLHEMLGLKSSGTRMQSCKTFGILQSHLCILE